MTLRRSKKMRVIMCMIALLSSLLMRTTSAIAQDVQNDVFMMKDQKAPFVGVLVPESNYQTYTQAMIENTNFAQYARDQAEPSGSAHFLLPLLIGVVFGVGGAAILHTR